MALADHVRMTGQLAISTLTLQHRIPDDWAADPWAEEVLVGEIRILHAGSRGAYGAPRIHAALRRAGRLVDEKKVERLMRVHDITGITRRRRRGLSRQAEWAVFAADLIGRDSTASRPGR